MARDRYGGSHCYIRDYGAGDVYHAATACNFAFYVAVICHLAVFHTHTHTHTHTMTPALPIQCDDNVILDLTVVVAFLSGTDTSHIHAHQLQ